MRRRARSIAVLSICLVAASSYFRLFIFPATPIVFWGDALLFAANGARLVSGQLPYRDYAMILPVGTDLTYSILFRLFGQFLWIPNLLMVCLAMGTCLLLVLCARRVVPDNMVVLSSLMFAGFVLYGSLDATHHWLSTVAIMAAILALLNGTGSARVAIAGSLCGVAASFTQSKGAAVLVGLVVYLLWQSRHTEPIQIRWRKCLLLCGAAGLVFLMMNGYYIQEAGLRRGIDSIIIFPIRHYPSIPINSWRAPWIDFQQQPPGLLKWFCSAFIYVLVPLAYLIFALLVRRQAKERPSEAWSQLTLIAIAGFAMLLAVVPSLSLKRIASVSPPALILLGWLVNKAQGKARTIAWALGIGSLAVALYLPARAQLLHWYYIDLPAGHVAIRDRGVYELYSWVGKHTHPGDMYFGTTAVAFPLWLQNPASIDAPLPWEYTRPEQIDQAIGMIEKKCVPLMVLRPYMYTPHLVSQDGEHLRLFQTYLNQNYRHATTFSTGDEVWERASTCH